MEFVQPKKEYYSRYTTLLKPYKQRTPINIFYHFYLNNSIMQKLTVIINIVTPVQVVSIWDKG